MLLKRIFLTILLFIVNYSFAQKENSSELIEVTNSIYMIKGGGGNIGLCIGTEGVFMIDDQYEKGIKDVLEKIKSLNDGPIKYLINTHHHGDHTGGNSTLAENGTTIFSHKNVRKRLIDADKSSSKKQRDFKLPIITFSEDMTFYYNEEQIMVFHVHQAHTDGDALVYFSKSNVIHTGDIFFNGKYPYIDLTNGGSVRGVINALNKVIMIADEETKIIPGHGALASVKEVNYTINMINDLWDQVYAQYKLQKTEDEVVTMKNITAKYDAKNYGTDWFISTERMIRTIYKDIAKIK